MNGVHIVVRPQWGVERRAMLLEVGSGLCHTRWDYIVRVINVGDRIVASEPPAGCVLARCFSRRSVDTVYETNSAYLNVILSKPVIRRKPWYEAEVVYGPDGILWKIASWIAHVGKTRRYE